MCDNNRDDDEHMSVLANRALPTTTPTTPTVKVRMQTSSHRGPLECVRQLLRTEGPQALFKGMSSPVLTASLVNAVVFSSYNEAMAVS